MVSICILTLGIGAALLNAFLEKHGNEQYALYLATSFGVPLSAYFYYKAGGFRLEEEGWSDLFLSFLFFVSGGIASIFDLHVNSLPMWTQLVLCVVGGIYFTLLLMQRFFR